MSKDRITGRNKELLQDAAQRLEISEDEVLSKVPNGILLMATFNDKALGGFLKRMQLDMSQAAVLEKQIADDKVGGGVLKVGAGVLDFLNKTQENSSQQQEEMSSAVSYQNWDKMNQMHLKHVATLSEKSENEVLKEISRDLGEALSNPEELENYLTAVLDSHLTINDSRTNDNPPIDVAAGYNASSCALTGENPTINEDCN